MKIKIKEKYPCGYELEFNAKGFAIRNINGLELGNCPIHKDKCKKENKEDE